MKEDVEICVEYLRGLNMDIFEICIRIAVCSVLFSILMIVQMYHSNMNTYKFFCTAPLFFGVDAILMLLLIKVAFYGIIG